MSVFPDAASGGIVIRDAAGTPLNPANVVNAYSPTAAFLSSCEITALPSDCSARITPAQLNSIVSELVSFAECLDPNGPWNCLSPQNLCNAFNVWASGINQFVDAPIDGNTYGRNNAAWVTVNRVWVSDAPPVAPLANDLWWESDSGAFSINYNDGNTIQWIQIAGGGGGGGSGGIGEAPIDGKPYVRINGAWADLSSTSGVIVVDGGTY